MWKKFESNYRALSRAAPQQFLINDGDYMTDEKTQQPLGVASDLNAELGLRAIIKLFLKPKLWRTKTLACFGVCAVLEEKKIFFSKDVFAISIRCLKTGATIKHHGILDFYLLMPFTLFLLLMMKVNKT